MSDIFLSAILKNFFKITFSLVILSFFFYIMTPFLVSITLGGILALALIPFVDYFIRRGFKRTTSVLIFSSATGLIGLVPVAAFFIHGSRVISKLLHESNFNDITQKLSKSSYKLLDQFSALYGLDKEMVRNKFALFVVYGGNYLSDSLNDFVSETPTILMMGAIITVSVYCFLRESDKIRSLFDRYFYFNKANGNKFVLMFKVCCREVFFSNLITGIVQATIVSLGAFFFDVGDFFLVFFITFVFSFIPILGAAPVAAFLGLICFMDARLGSGIGMIIVALVAGTSDNILRPFMGSLGEVKVHPFIGFLSVIGGVIMFGLPGLFIGPLVVTLSFGALPIIIDEYFPPNVQSVSSEKS
jgi:predicted PurR-regulated permease PerM